MSDYLKYASSKQVGMLFDWVDPANPPSAPFLANIDTRQNLHLQSQSNPFINGHYRDGGNFMSVKRVTALTPSASIVVWRPGFGIAYKGQLTVPPYDRALDHVNSSANSLAMTNLSNQGAVAWNRLRPDLPDFSLATSLGELKDMPGMLKDAVKGVRNLVRRADKKRKSQGKSGLSKSGQYYLALQFGWLPILSDVQNFVKAQKNGQKRLTQLIRDEGKPVRRSATLNDTGNMVGTTDTSLSNDGWGGGLSPSFVTQCYKRNHPTYRYGRRNSSKRTWAEGQFRYHLPPGPRDVVWQKRMLRRIMGSRVTPDTIYNLMPWSWLVDYFTDLGQFIQAISPGVADRLAADYAYVMQTEVWTFTREASSVYQGGKMDNSLFNEAVASSIVIDYRKMRHRASPFGWGVKQTDLTPRQLAILAALGLSKLP